MSKSVARTMPALKKECLIHLTNKWDWYCDQIKTNEAFRIARGIEDQQDLIDGIDEEFFGLRGFVVSFFRAEDADAVWEVLRDFEHGYPTEDTPAVKDVRMVLIEHVQKKFNNAIGKVMKYEAAQAEADAVELSTPGL